MNIRHIGIVVRNMDKMKMYYQKLGFLPLDEHEEIVKIAKLQNDNGDMVELLQYASQMPWGLRKAGLSHVAFTTDPEGNYLELVEKENGLDE